METGENQKKVATASHTSLEISPKPPDSHVPTVPTTTARVGKQKDKAAAPSKRKPRADRWRVNKGGHLDKLNDIVLRTEGDDKHVSHSCHPPISICTSN